MQKKFDLHIPITLHYITNDNWYLIAHRVNIILLHCTNILYFYTDFCFVYPLLLFSDRNIRYSFSNVSLFVSFNPIDQTNINTDIKVNGYQVVDDVTVYVIVNC